MLKNLNFVVLISLAVANYASAFYARAILDKSHHVPVLTMDFSEAPMYGVKYPIFIPVAHMYSG